MEPSEPQQLRIPGVLVPSYQRLISTEDGKSAMKRIRVECGVCKVTRFYSIHRGITRIAGIVACEACRQFYQRFKKQPWILDCSKGGRCYEQDETPKNKCKACWVAHIICKCPVPLSLYNNLIGYLPTELKAKMAARPPSLDKVPENKRGGLGLEVYKDDNWIDVTDKSEVESLMRSEDGNDSDEANEQETEVDVETVQDAEEAAVDDPGIPDDNEATEQGTEQDEDEAAVDDPGIPDEDESAGHSSASTGNGASNKRLRKTRYSSDVDPDERVMSTLIEGLHVNNQNKFMENFNPKTSERVKRKKNKVQYFNSNSRTKGPTSQFAHGPDGSLLGTGKDLCDCLQGDCPGCHFPCPKCSSRKCGTECRMNRKWYYDKVEVEGTKLYWMNEWIKKK